MFPAISTTTDTSEDPLARYVTTVHGLHEKLGRVFSHHHEIAENMGRVAAALRSFSVDRERQ